MARRWWADSGDDVFPAVGTLPIGDRRGIAVILVLVGLGVAHAPAGRRPDRQPAGRGLRWPP